MKEKSHTHLETLVRRALDEGYPEALQIKTVTHGSTLIQKIYGKPYKYFDVASLTKVMVTVPLVMRLYENREIKLEDPVSKFLPFLRSTPMAKTKIQDLLCHLSGLVWWKPYYKELVKASPSARSALLKSLMRHEKLGPRKKCIYSDPDFIVLGWLIEEVLDLPLEEAANLFVFAPLKLRETFFLSDSVKHKLNVAPTEKTSHRGVVRGIVHDDNAWALGGISAHAGLFSTLEDVSRFGEILLAHHLGRAEILAKASTLKKFTARAVPRSKGDWALGFMIPSRPVSSAGARVSENAFGHTGFTGTSLWIDVKRETSVAVLSNRTFPTRRDERFINLRRQIHDVIWNITEEKVVGRG